MFVFCYFLFVLILCVEGSSSKYNPPSMNIQLTIVLSSEKPTEM